MRVKEWGKFAAEFSDFSGRVITGQSIIIDNHNENRDEGGRNITTGIGGENAWIFGNGGLGPSKSYHTIKLARLRAELGHTPVIIRARWYIHIYFYHGSYPSAGREFGLFRCLPGRITQSQATYRFRATGQTYYGDGYSPLHGTDVAATPFSTTLIPKRSVFGYFDYFDITDELLYALRANEDLFFLLRWLPLGSGPLQFGNGAEAYWDFEGKRPYLQISYLNNLEFFAADPATGEIDLTRLLDNTTANAADWLYLGALQRSETSTPVKFFLRNFSERAYPLVVVWKAHPDWTIPVQTAGTGTGSLDYVQLADTAVWQKYTITMTSSTAYTVKAEAYRANPIGLNPTGGGTGWTGTTNANWTAPAGGLTIPAAAWQPGTAVNDVFEFFIMGTATDATWPLDSDEQVQITHDVAGSPDPAGWRSITAAYTRSTAPVTINGTTRKIPTRAILVGSWTVGSPAFIGSHSNVHEGVVVSADAANIGTVVFTGTGLNDLTASGNYNGTFDGQFVVKIDSTGTPDTFRWSKDGGTSWEATNVPITGSAQRLSDGVHVTFAATTGHTLNDYWTIPVVTWGVTLGGLANDGTVYPAGAVVSTGLPVRNLTAGTWTKTTSACGASSAPANRIPVGSVTGFTAADVIAIQSVDNPDRVEIRTISAVGPTYLDLTANLTNDYESGSVVTKRGSGERAMWLRVVTTAITAEEIKRFRLSARS